MESTVFTFVRSTVIKLVRDVREHSGGLSGRSTEEIIKTVLESAKVRWEHITLIDMITKIFLNVMQGADSLIYCVRLVHLKNFLL